MNIMLGVVVFAMLGTLLSMVCVIFYIGARLGLEKQWAVLVTILLWLILAGSLSLLGNTWLLL